MNHMSTHRAKGIRPACRHESPDRFLTATFRGGCRGSCHAFGGVALQRELDMGVVVGGDRDVGVTKQLLDHDDIRVLIQQERGA